MKKLIVIMMLVGGASAWAADPFIPPVPDDEVTSEVRADVENLRFRLRRAEETITDMEAFLIEINQRVGTAGGGGAEQPVLVGQSETKEYYRLPDGTLYVWEKGSDAPRPRAGGMRLPPPPPPPEGANGV